MQSIAVPTASAIACLFLPGSTTVLIMPTASVRASRAGAAIHCAHANNNPMIGRIAASMIMQFVSISTVGSLRQRRIFRFARPTFIFSSVWGLCGRQLRAPVRIIRLPVASSPVVTVLGVCINYTSTFVVWLVSLAILRRFRASAVIFRPRAQQLIAAAYVLMMLPIPFLRWYLCRLMLRDSTRVRSRPLTPGFKNGLLTPMEARACLIRSRACGRKHILLRAQWLSSITMLNSC